MAFGGLLAALSCRLSGRISYPPCVRFTQGPAATGLLVFLCGGDKVLYNMVAQDLHLTGKVRAPSTSMYTQREKTRMSAEEAGIGTSTEADASTERSSRISVVHYYTHFEGASIHFFRRTAVAVCHVGWRVWWRCTLVMVSRHAWMETH